MADYIEPIMRLVNNFSKLPSVGARSALKYAYKVIAMSDEEAAELAESILAAKRNIRYCSVCGNFTDLDPCEICKKRDGGTIMVVKEPKDVFAIERTRDYKGVYHVLHGTISPLNGVGPDDIHLAGLLKRVASGEVKEVIVATNPDVEGEATAMYVAKLLKPLSVNVTRIAHGIPLGSELEYTDEVTLARAIQDRKPL